MPVYDVSHQVKKTMFKSAMRKVGTGKALLFFHVVLDITIDSCLSKASFFLS